VPNVTAGALAKNFASQKFLDSMGRRASHPYDFPVLATQAEIGILFDEIGQASNAQEMKRRFAVDVEVVEGDPDIETYDEAVSNVEIAAVLIFVNLANRKDRRYIFIPAPDLSILDSNRSTVVVTAGQGQAVFNAARTLYPAADWGYAGSYVQGKDAVKNRYIPPVVEPAGTDTPGQAPALP